MNTTFSVFSPQQWQVLQALNQYRFLTVEQMLSLGISRNAISLRSKTLFALRYHKAIHSEKIGSFLPDVHSLTKKGADLLSDLEGIDVPFLASRKKQAFSALFARHRFAQVDFHIGINLWVHQRGDAEVILELQDFVRQSASGKSRATASTQLSVSDIPNPIIPDGTFAVELSSGKIALYLVEIHRSTQTKAVTDQLMQYFKVIRNGTIQQKYGYAVHPIICSVHHQPSVLNSVKSRLLADPKFEPFKQNFVFHGLEDLTSNFTGGWHFADNSPAHPFPLPKPSTT